MSVVKVAGSAFAIASAYGSSKSMTALSNATEGVATLEASHGVVENDILELTSGWDLLTGRIARADSVATNDVTLEDIDTSSTTRFPAGSGTGSIREITTWVSLSQITADFSVSGGEQNFADATFISHLIRQRIPTDRNPIEITLPFFFDLSLAWVATVRAAAAVGTPVALRLVLPNNNVMYANCYWSIREVPTVSDGTLRGQIDLSIVGTPTLYAS